MNRKGEIKKSVYKILLEDEYARENDGYLFVRVIQELEPELAGTAFVNIMQNIQYRGISYATITRVRRDFNKDYPKLAIERTERARRIKEKEFHEEYSKS